MAVEPRLQSYDDLVDHCWVAWNKLVNQPWRIMSIGLRHWAHLFFSTRTGTGALIVQTMLTVVTQNSRLPRRSALSGDRIVKSHECKAGPPENLGPLELRCAYLAPWTVPKSVRSASAQKTPTTIRIGASSSTPAARS